MATATCVVGACSIDGASLTCETAFVWETASVEETALA